MYIYPFVIDSVSIFFSQYEKLGQGQREEEKKRDGLQMIEKTAAQIPFISPVNVKEGELEKKQKLISLKQN